MRERAEGFAKAKTHAAFFLMTLALAAMLILAGSGGALADGVAPLLGSGNGSAPARPKLCAIVPGTEAAPPDTCPNEPEEITINSPEPDENAASPGNITRQIARITSNLPKAGISERDSLRIAGQIGAVRPVGTAIAAPPKPTEASGASEIATYYRARTASIVATPSMSVEGQISALKDLNGEIDVMIAQLVREKGTVNATELEQFDANITVGKNGVSVNGQAVAGAARTIVAQVKERQLSVVQMTGRNLLLDDGRSNASVRGDEKVEVAGGRVLVDGRELAVTPSEIGTKIGFSPADIQISGEGGRLVYQVNGTENRRLLGIIPVRVPASARVSAETGEKISETRPWWASLLSSPA